MYRVERDIHFRNHFRPGPWKNWMYCATCGCISTGMSYCGATAPTSKVERSVISPRSTTGSSPESTSAASSSRARSGLAVPSARTERSTSGLGFAAGSSTASSRARISSSSSEAGSSSSSGVAAGALVCAGARGGALGDASETGVAAALLRARRRKASDKRISNARRRADGGSTPRRGAGLGAVTGSQHPREVGREVEVDAVLGGMTSHTHARPRPGSQHRPPGPVRDVDRSLPVAVLAADVLPAFHLVHPADPARLLETDDVAGHAVQAVLLLN